MNEQAGKEREVYSQFEISTIVDQNNYYAKEAEVYSQFEISTIVDA